MNSFPWLLRRELWENRSVYLVPLVFLTLLVLLYTWVILAHGPGGMIHIDIDDGVVDVERLIKETPRGRHIFKMVAGGLPFVVPAVLLNAVMLFVWFFYLNDSLYAERKDRSVLFWKSLPVNDTNTVLSKLLTAMIVIPALTFVGIMIAAAGMTLANTLFVWTIDESPWQLVWSQLPFISGPVALLYAMVVQSFWYAPVFGWLLLTSAWARRAPALWALLPPAGIALLEAAALRTSHFADMVGQRLTPVVPTAFHDQDFERVLSEMNPDADEIAWSEAFGSLIDPGSFLSDPGMWMGLVFAGIFVAGAIWARRYRTEM